MFSNWSSGEPLPHWEEVVKEEEVVAAVEEDHLGDRTQPSNQWHQPLMSEPWEKNPKISSAIEKRPKILSKK
jgi:hypothetical protein